MSDPFLTTEELAERWRTSPSAIHNLRHRGRVPRGHKIGKRVLYKLSDVEAFEAGRADEPQPAAS